MPTNRIRQKLASLLIVLCGFVLVLPASLANSPGNEQPLTVFAAASLADVLPALDKAWRSENEGPESRISLGASAVMARQIEAGAGASLFISANPHWVDHLHQQQLAKYTPKPVANNRLVLAFPCSGKAPEIATIPDLVRYLKTNRFAMADPAISPAGEYTRGLLQKHQAWSQVKSNAAFAGNVRLTLLLIERGGIPGFVYESDVSKSQLACEATMFDFSKEITVRYHALIPTSIDVARERRAISFLDWLTSPEAAQIWQQYGFTPTVPN